MIDFIYLGLYRFFGFLLRVLPHRILRILMKTLSWTAYILSKKHRNIINTNLDIVYKNTMNADKKKKIAIASFMNLLDTVFGIIKREGMTKEEVIEDVTFEGTEIIKSYQKNNKNFILITGHYGNWELLSQAITIRFDLNLVGIGRKIDSDKIDQVLKKNREQFNVEMAYKKGAMKASVQAISEGKVVGILTDQAIRQNQSIEVEFFGKKATHTPLASILSRKFNLDLIPAFITTRDYRHYNIKIYNPIRSLHTKNKKEDLTRLTQQQADIMQKVILSDPYQWFWMHRRYKNYIEYK